MQGTVGCDLELLLHASNLLSAALQLLQTDSISAEILGVLDAFGSHQALEHSDQLQVGGWGDVVGSAQLSFEVLRNIPHLHECTHTRGLGICNSAEACHHRCDRVCREHGLSNNNWYLQYKHSQKVDRGAATLPSVMRHDLWTRSMHPLRKFAVCNFILRTFLCTDWHSSTSLTLVGSSKSISFKNL